MLLAATNPLPLGTMTMGLFGGLAIFLLGMDQMTGTLKKVAGSRMETLLKMLTTNRFSAVLAGAFVTSIIQSSSVTTVLVVGFVSAGLMTLTQSIGVIMGAGIGTTITAQMLAFRITRFALALVAIGFALQFVSKREKLRDYGTMLLGFGLLFFGMTLMSEAMAPLRTHQPFRDAMAQLDNPLLGMLLAALFTALIQSSSATTAMIISMAGQGLITTEQAIPMVFGANIGTCITAVLASIGKPREAVRAALVHVIFNVMGVALWFGLINQLAAVVQWLAADNVPRQIAHAHTLFNVSNTCVCIWFTTPLAWFVRLIVPDRPEAKPEWAQPKYLDDLLIQTPALAIDMVRMELGHLGLASLHMARNALTTAIRGSKAALDELEAMDDKVDALHAAIITYLSQLSRENLSSRQSEQLHDYLSAANYFENIGDMIETNLVDAGRQRLRNSLEVSEATEKVLNAFHHKVCWSVERAVRALVESDPVVAREVMDAKAEVNRLAAAAEDHLSRRLAADAPNRLVAFRLESEIMEYMKRMYYFAKRIAKLVETSNAMPPEDSDVQGEEPEIEEVAAQSHQ